ncbi:hypothetical protein NQ176_g2332 [Zarea fungicola]|uniref:Uncharacterized protein n=1 Tax=Zarea fungicola TaxID=93591 RepID=A0ACC1NQ09_9HYPO|nr:hypothetical protein NQ176_g2332 [Lecanicillium fungicola]
MSRQLVLITGATGHIGYQVLLKALDAGYNVRVTVRSKERMDTLLATKSLKPWEARLSFVTVPDMTASGAYDEAIQGANYVIHLASPLFEDDLKPSEFEKHLLQPAVQGTLGILEAAKRSPEIKRVVITSSILALVPWGVVIGGSGDIITTKSRTANPNFPTINHPFEAYCASKIIAFNKTEEWIRNENPSFDVVHINPSYVLGRDELRNTPELLLGHGTNRIVLSVALGLKNEDPMANCTVHVDDVARAHVESLNPKIPGNAVY